MRTEIYIATHKPFQFPEKQEYIPIQVGKVNSDIDLKITSDDTGENISELNESFCELTALYWMWKNSDADILGLCHYRRYFIDEKKEILSQEKILSLTKKKPFIIVANREKFFKEEKKHLYFFNKEFFYSVEEQYKIVHFEKDWLTLENTLKEIHPSYFSAFKKVARKRSGISFYNMFIADKIIVNQYCEWLFKLLFELKNRISIESYSPYQRRIFGFMAERLLNVFLEKHKNEFDIRYQPVILLD